MEKILVIVFDDEAKAYGGAHALEQMEKQGYLSFEKLTIVAKNRDGTTCALKTWGDSWGSRAASQALRSD
jgi:uncharacterized membrane protein